MKKKEAQKSKFYVSSLALYKMVQFPYKDREVGDTFIYTIMHTATSEKDADTKVKVYFAKEIFSDEDIEIFGCSSIEVTHETIDRILTPIPEQSSSSLPTNNE